VEFGLELGPGRAMAVVVVVVVVVARSATREVLMCIVFVFSEPK
jgi:hypothetical protein